MTLGTLMRPERRGWYVLVACALLSASAAKQSCVAWAQDAGRVASQRQIGAPDPEAGARSEILQQLDPPADNRKDDQDKQKRDEENKQELLENLLRGEETSTDSVDILLERVIENPAGKNARELLPFVTLRALDKVTARSFLVNIPVGAVFQLGNLRLSVRHCRKLPPSEEPETFAYLEITEERPEQSFAKTRPIATQALFLPYPETQKIVADQNIPVSPDALKVSDASLLLATGRKVFQGWMFASQPALVVLEHPIYDVQVVDCSLVMGMR